MDRPGGAVSIGQAVRLAAGDFYFNSLRFVPANVAWGLSVVLVLFAALAWPPALALSVLVAIPLAGLHRMAALVARGEPASLSDFGDGMRRYALPATGIAAAGMALAGVLATNVLLGFGSDGPLGWFLGATALYGLAALAMLLVAIWPVLVDPRREHLPLRGRLRAAGLVVLGRPGRLFALTALIVAVLIASTALLGLVVLFAVAWCSLLATRWVLPAADELEARYEAARAR